MIHQIAKEVHFQRSGNPSRIQAIVLSDFLQSTHEEEHKSPLNHLPVLCHGCLSQRSEGSASAARFIATNGNLVLPVTKRLRMKDRGNAHHLHDGSTLLALEVHFHHHRANGPHPNNCARYTHQLADEIRLNVLERDSGLKVKDPHSESGIYDTVYCCNDHSGGG